MRPVRQGETLDLYAGGDFSLGDRVAAVGDGGSPPFGARGYVVAVHGEACEVLFDREFVGGPICTASFRTRGACSSRAPSS